MGRNGTKVGRNGLTEGQRLVLSVELRTQELEVDEQTFLVVDNLRLVGHHLHVGGIAITLVVDDECKLRRLHRLNLLRQCIVTHDVALHEVSQVEFGRRLHRQRDWIELASHLKTRIRIYVAECTAKGVVDGSFRSSILRWDKQDGSGTCAVGTQMPTGIHRQFASKARQRFGMHLELLGCSQRTSLTIGHLKFQLDVLHRRIGITVRDGQRTAEGLTCHRHRLVNLQRDGGTSAATAFLQLFVELLHFVIKQFADIFVATFTSRSIGIVHDVELSKDEIYIHRILCWCSIVQILQETIHAGNEVIEL